MYVSIAIGATEDKTANKIIKYIWPIDFLKNPPW
jgi:hypothetical protein